VGTDEAQARFVLASLKAGRTVDEVIVEGGGSEDPNVAATIRRRVDDLLAAARREVYDPAVFYPSLAVALSAAALGSIVWAGMAVFFQREMVLLAIGIGVFVAQATLWVAGGRKGPVLQHIVGWSSVGSVVFGKILHFVGMICLALLVGKDVPNGQTVLGALPSMFAAYLRDTVGPIDALFVLLPAGVAVLFLDPVGIDLARYEPGARPKEDDGSSRPEDGVVQRIAIESTAVPLDTLHIAACVAVCWGAVYFGWSWLTSFVAGIAGPEDAMPVVACTVAVLVGAGPLMLGMALQSLLHRPEAAVTFGERSVSLPEFSLSGLLTSTVPYERVSRVWVGTWEHAAPTKTDELRILRAAAGHGEDLPMYPQATRLVVETNNGETFTYWSTDVCSPLAEALHARVQAPFDVEAIEMAGLRKWQVAIFGVVMVVVIVAILYHFSTAPLTGV